MHVLINIFWAAVLCRCCLHDRPSLQGFDFRPDYLPVATAKADDDVLRRAPNFHSRHSHNTNTQKPRLLSENRVSFLQLTHEAFIDETACGIDDFSQSNTTQSYDPRSLKLCCNFDGDQS
jgi:hypothetical protein